MDTIRFGSASESWAADSIDRCDVLVLIVSAENQRQVISDLIAAMVDRRLGHVVLGRLSPEFEGHDADSHWMEEAAKELRQSLADHVIVVTSLLDPVLIIQARLHWSILDAKATDDKRRFSDLQQHPHADAVFQRFQISRNLEDGEQKTPDPDAFEAMWQVHIDEITQEGSTMAVQNPVTAHRTLASEIRRVLRGLSAPSPNQSL